MRFVRPFPLFAIALAVVFSAASSPASPATEEFEGIWIGEIAAPNARTPFGLGFTRTEKGLLVSVHMPEMFLHSVNFGPADIQNGVFQLPALDLRVHRQEDKLIGTFAPAALPVELRRGSSFTAEPLPPAFPAAPAPLWTHPLGAPAWAAPIVRDGIIYVGTTDGRFHAVRSDSGQELWSWAGGVPLYGEALATDDSVYFINEAGVLTCLIRTDGALKWQLTLADHAPGDGPAPANETFNHRTPAPVIDSRGVLYIGTTDGGIHAVKAATGKKLWHHPAGARIYASLTLLGDELVAGCFDGTVLILNRNTRRETLRTKVGGPIVSAPVIAAGRIILGSRDYLLYGLDQKSGRVVWRDSFWFSWIESNPRLIDGVLYIGASDFRRVSAIDPATGRTWWATDVRGLSWGTPVVTPDTVFAGTVGQNIEGTAIQHVGGIVALDRKTGAVKWRYSTPRPSDAAFEGFAGSLVASGPLIIGADVQGRLIAFPANSEAGRGPSH